ncbi:TIR domain-containing protein [Rufibacter soli]
MPDKKVIFIAFAIEDEAQRNLLKGQSLNTNTPFEYIDMSVKEAYDNDWQQKVLTRIRRSDGVIFLISRNSLASTGQKEEFRLAKLAGKKCLGIWAYNNDRTIPVFINGTSIIPWTWAGIASFINSL